MNEKERIPMMEFVLFFLAGTISSFLGGWGYEIFGIHVFSFGLASSTLISAGITSYLIPEQLKLQKVKKDKPIISRVSRAISS